MVIEIETDDYKDGFFEKAKEHDGVETYLCYHTINLNPFHCRIYFMHKNRKIMGPMKFK